MAAVCELSLGILSRHPIRARNVIGHSDVAPDRKDDPGELFDWRGLAQNGVGLWPQHEAAPVPDVTAALAAIGYRTDLPQDVLFARLPAPLAPGAGRRRGRRPDLCPAGRGARVYRRAAARMSATSSGLTPASMTPEEFLTWEEKQELRYEFDGVRPVAMDPARGRPTRTSWST